MKAAFIGMNDLHVPWRHTRPGIMAIAGIIPIAELLAKIKQRSDVGCRLCKRAREQHGASTIFFARGDVWAHQHCLLHWNGDNCHAMTQLHTTSSGDICHHAGCTNTNE